jgi:cytochrome c oxidase cbb3-type subunit 3
MNKTILSTVTGASMTLLAIFMTPTVDAQNTPDLGNLTLVQIYNSPELKDAAVAGGKSAFEASCSGCHGMDATGQPTIPDLADYDWLWGSALSDIEYSIRYGIRSGHENQRYSEMPGYDNPDGLTKSEMNDLVEYVFDISGNEAVPDAVARAEDNFISICSECHDADGKGLIEWYGGPNLTDEYWLYGGTREDIYESIAVGRLGTSPAWDGVLDDDTIKMLTVYVYYLTHY